MGGCADSPGLPTGGRAGILRDTVNKWVVRTLLECILVLLSFSLSLGANRPLQHQQESQVLQIVHQILLSKRTLPIRIRLHCRSETQTVGGKVKFSVLSLCSPRGRGSHLITTTTHWTSLYRPPTLYKALPSLLLTSGGQD